MKKVERKSITTEFVTSVSCDITQEPCKDLKCFEDAKPDFDYGVLKYTGGYGSAYDFLEVELDLHPDLVVALFLLSHQGKQMADRDWCYKTPKFKITIEEQDENQSSD